VLTADVGGDQEWAYLFSGHRIHGYVLVHRPRYRLGFRPIACWHIHDPPNLVHAELAAIQRAGQPLRRHARFDTTGNS
jgi:hypothetical protein